MPSSDAFTPLVDAAAGVATTFRPLVPDGPPAEPVASVLAPPPAPAAPAPEDPVEAPAPVERLEDHPAWHAGYAQARAEMEAELHAARRTLAESLENLTRFQAQLRSRYERELLLVALGVARKVVQQELQERPEIWMAMIRSAVRQAVDRERILIRVPPALAAWLLEHAQELKAQLEDVKEMQIVDDPALPPGGCIVESRYGEVDVGVETQLAVAEQALVRVGG
jgi:flagellar biosynthesis/type III secretory pathway protein FliH